MVFKAIVVDIDGTITYPDRRLDFTAAEKLRSLKVPVVLATGNILCYARATSKLIGLSGATIAENGGIFSTAYDNKPHIVEGTLEECERAVEYLSTFFDITRLDAEYRKTEVALRRDFDASEARRILRKEKFEVEIIDTNYAIHVKNSRVDKGTGLIELARLLDFVPGDFIAIGDSENDREMLQVSGFGIAVSNADVDTKKNADLVTSRAYGEGTSEAIDYLISKKMI
ncbi:SPP-like hydrolase [Methanosalsum zhilinae DSM 4017]|uniref:Phosphoglycolate phosphatase n=1 Tax=Methanosalsum zhilinae (strain DSM 4017 / NBRC 107636 / OCM 62 / WeN5) TaxID=679901 RepID=F7XKI9_METZD|nr:phosphoglycolate phosphatase [Methanosalsum zhilinae]AEH61764.1 SPP-like hydrolase [Methanosalsum zhilinae DSM 4017]